MGDSRSAKKKLKDLRNRGVLHRKITQTWETAEISFDADKRVLRVPEHDIDLEKPTHKDGRKFSELRGKANQIIWIIR